MRIVIDLQGMQTQNRSRGIGRYSKALALAMARNRGEHDIILALNGLFPDSIDVIKDAFYGLLPRNNIRIWHAVGPTAQCDANNDWRRKTAEKIREAFLSSLNPDIVHISSFFEGLGDSAITSIGALPAYYPTAVTCYDLIPFIYSKLYLENPVDKSWYYEKLEMLRRADLLLCISDSTRRECVEHLGLPLKETINISSDADNFFQQMDISPATEKVIREKYDLDRPFIMYTGGIDHRKNIEGLIRAFSILPLAVRKVHQLAIVCSVQPESRRLFEQQAAQLGLGKNEVILTGFVPEDDLLTLYNICKLFVFPSKHEGFGLPVLEAMRCGAPVIGSDTSSIPEVIGLEKALFDPHSDKAMSEAIECALTDTTFQAELIQNGQEQAGKFSWDETARRALSAMERLVSERSSIELHHAHGKRPKLAYVSPLPPERSGIAYYSAELLPELARFYTIDVIVNDSAITDPWISENCQIRTVQWFVENADQYERVIYHFGNSSFHAHMFDLLRKIPGVIVLHDFFLSSVITYMDIHGVVPGCWSDELYLSHGYKALHEQFHAEDAADIVGKYPCNLSIIQNSLGVIAHSSYSKKMSEQWYAYNSMEWSLIPLLRDSRLNGDFDGAREKLGFCTSDFIVCSFGSIGETKLNHRLLTAWYNSLLHKEKNCYLIFVGENPLDQYGKDFIRKICDNKTQKNTLYTGWLSQDRYALYLAAADLGVQLRTLSRGETSAAVLDCMNYGLATIINANGSMGELDDNAVWKLPDEFSDAELINALETLWQDKEHRRQLGKNARKSILELHNPPTCAAQYADAIEKNYRTALSGLPALPKAIASIQGQVDDLELMQTAEAMALSFPPVTRTPQIFVDISELVKRDAKSGIQRVVRNILNEWLHNPPEGFRIEPVYATVNHEYRYARRFTLELIDCPVDVLQDACIDYAPGDIFIGLDLQPEVVCTKRNFYKKMRRQGVQVHFVVYDLLCVLLPQYFVQGAQNTFEKWLRVVAENDGALCISKTVADTLSKWLSTREYQSCQPFRVKWFHLGADMEDATSSKGVPATANVLISKINSLTSFLMVGTLEPRKAHAQVLEAFEELWQVNKDIALVIVGKQGWLTENLADKIRNHPELGKRLFWLEGISDEYLNMIYSASNCVIAASYGEGFGLPLIEAAQHNIPIIARDIPVFREVAGKHAFYFNATTANELAQAIQEWINLYKQEKHPKSQNMPWMTWKESANQLLNILLETTEHTNN